MYRIIKFGGSVLRDSVSLHKAARIISACEEQAVVVCSAMKGVTSKLREAANHNDPRSARKILEDVLTFYMETASRAVSAEYLTKVIESIDLLGKQLSRKQDKSSIGIASESIISAGENLTAYILDGVLRSMGLDPAIVFPGQIPLVTEPGKRRIDLRRSGERLHQLLDSRDTFIVPGFYAVDFHGRPVTLGESGSDYTAACLGYLTDSVSVDLWKDTHGFLSGDPEKISSVHSHEQLYYEEAAELAYNGAAIIHPETIPPLKAKGIPLRILSFAHAHSGSDILTSISGVVKNGEPSVKGVTCIEDLGVIRISGSDVGNEPGILAGLTASLNLKGINIKSVLTSQTNINILVDGKDLGLCRAALFERFSSPVRQITFSDALSLVSIVGRGINTHPGIAARAFTALAGKGINASVICAGASPVSVYFLVPRDKCHESAEIVHDEFFRQEVRV